MEKADSSQLDSLDESFVRLRSRDVCKTVEQLSLRISERFPNSGLSRISEQLLDTAQHTAERVRWIAQPIIPLRLATISLLGILGSALLVLLYSLELPSQTVSIVDFIQILEAGINDLVLLGAAVFFVATLESRIKRKRALQAIHELRSLAHIIDMHQLTKDPQRLVFGKQDTKSSPERTFTPFEMGRYLDYCSELLSLTGKVATLYVQHFDDPVAISAVHDVQQLTGTLSAKIWQKLVILTSNQQMAV